VEYEDAECDTGVVQIDSLRLDEAATVARAAAFYRDFHARVAREVSVLRLRRPSLIIGDIPPLASAAAAAVGLPSVLIGNFTWDWIYEGYDGFTAGAPEVLTTIRDAYRQATLALRLPMWGGFGPLRAVTRDIPLIARHATRSASDVRQQLGLPEAGPLVLASFGGHGLRDLDPASLAANRGYTIVLTGHQPAVRQPAPNVCILDEREIYADGLRYEDLVAAADVVVTKPGYGIVAEAIANDTAILYTSRGHFVEYEVLVEGMQRLTRCRYIPMNDLLGGHWAGHLDRLRREPAAARKPATNGAEVAAGEILKLLDGNEE
jgi:L-arabinokinase